MASVPLTPQQPVPCCGPTRLPSRAGSCSLAPRLLQQPWHPQHCDQAQPVSALPPPCPHRQQLLDKARACSNSKPSGSTHVCETNTGSKPQFCAKSPDLGLVLKGTTSMSGKAPSMPLMSLQKKQTPFSPCSSVLKNRQLNFSHTLSTCLTVDFLYSRITFDKGRSA